MKRKLRTYIATAVVVACCVEMYINIEGVVLHKLCVDG